MKHTLLVAALLLILPLSSQAAQFFSGELVAPADDIADDVYAAGQRLEFRHRLGSDLFAAGNTIDVAQTVDGDIFAAGSSIVISGPVEDDIIAVGKSITLSGERVGDVLVAGSDITLRPTTTVDGSLYAAGSTVAIGGTITGSVYVAADTVLILPEANIAGDLIVHGPKEPTVSQEATIGGAIRHRVRTDLSDDGRGHVLDWVRGVLTWFVAALVLLLLLPAGTHRVISQGLMNPLRSFAVGILFLILVMPIIVLLLATVLGAPLAFGLLALLMLTIILAFIITPLFIGIWIYRRLSQGTGETITWQHALLGVFAMKLVALVPILGWLLLVMTGICVLGAVLGILWRTWRGTPEPPAPVVDPIPVTI